MCTAVAATGVLLPAARGYVDESLASAVERCVFEYPGAPDRLICFDRIAQSIAASRPLPGAVVVIAEIAGEQNEPLPFFVADGPWVLEWTAQGGFFQIRDRGQFGGRVAHVYASQSGYGSGVSMEYPPGRYNLETRAAAKWHVRIVKR